MKINGFVIMIDAGSPMLASDTFAHTAHEAWSRKIGAMQAVSPDRPIIIQRWHDRGYRPVKATMEIET